MDWLKANQSNPIFLLAIAVVVIAVWFVFGKGSKISDTK